MGIGVGPEHVVVGQDVGEPEALHLLGVGAHRTCVGSDLGLGEHDTESHSLLSTRWPGRPRRHAEMAVTRR